MKTGKRLGVTLLALAAGLSACQRHADPPAPDTAMINATAALVEPATASAAADDDGCPTDAAQQFVGKPDGASLRSALAQAAGAHPVRWITPGAAVTQDYQPDRLNVIIGDDGRVQSLRCG